MELNLGVRWRGWESRAGVRWGGWESRAGVRPLQLWGLWHSAVSSWGTRGSFVSGEVWDGSCSERDSEQGWGRKVGGRWPRGGLAPGDWGRSEKRQTGVRVGFRGRALP